MYLMLTARCFFQFCIFVCWEAVNYNVGATARPRGQCLPVLVNIASLATMICTSSRVNHVLTLASFPTLIYASSPANLVLTIELTRMSHLPWIPSMRTSTNNKLSCFVSTVASSVISMSILKFSTFLIINDTFALPRSMYIGFTPMPSLPLPVCTQVHKQKAPSER